MPDKIIIFTDGASKGNPGPGGFGAVVVWPEGQVIELGGFEKLTTNNRMELSGAVSALTEIRERKEEVEVYTDSKYLIGGMTGWIYGWQKNGWQTKDKKEVLNRDLWEKLAELVKGRKIKWNYVGGHVGVAGNERCDEIASGLALGEKVALYKGKLEKYKVDVLNIQERAPEKFSPLNGVPNRSEKISGALSKKRAKAYSYVSLVNGVAYKDQTWAECEKRVKGKSGVKFKKAVSAEDEQEILKKWNI